MKKTYSEMIKDPRWQKKRLEIMGRDNFECQYCGDAESTLSVHHLYYASPRDPWDYPEWCLVTLCEECHKSTHGIAPGPEIWELAVSFFASPDPLWEHDFIEIAELFSVLVKKLGRNKAYAKIVDFMRLEASK